MHTFCVTVGMVEVALNGCFRTGVLTSFSLESYVSIRMSEGKEKEKLGGIIVYMYMFVYMY